MPSWRVQGKVTFTFTVIMATWHKYVSQRTVGDAKGLRRLATLFVRTLRIKEFGSSGSFFNGDTILRVVCDVGLIAAVQGNHRFGNKN
jgi:hypothetical protein